MKNLCCFSNDVETTSIVNGGLRPETGVKVWQEGLPRLLDIYARHGVKTTFFVVADFAQAIPAMVRMLQEEGHEVGLHGLTHDHRRAFDTMTFEKQVHDLKEGKKILEDIMGEEVVSFRAPALRVNSFTPKALVETGFLYDSSVAPQRLDMFMTLGSKKKLSWIFAPRVPYYVSENNLARQGNMPLLEVPVSSFGLPYVGTFMRVAPALNKCVRWCLYLETRHTHKIVNFLIHPNELIEEEDLRLATERRASNYLSYLLSDVLRRKLKQRNLGIVAAHMYEREIEFWKRKGFGFVRIKDITSTQK